MPTAILIDPFEGAMNSLPSTLKDIFKKIVQKLKSLYKGLIGEFNNRNFAPRTLEDAVLSIYQDGNTYTATDNLNQRVRYSGEEKMSYQEYRENVLKRYADPSLYTKAKTSSDNVYVYKDFYQDYVEGKLNKDLKKKIEKNIRGANALGSLGYVVYVLPEQIIIADERYNGKIADRIINGFLAEFKEITSITYSQFKKQLKNGMQKADIIYMSLSSKKTTDSNGSKRSIVSSINGQTKGKEKYEGKVIVTSLKGQDLVAYEIKNGTPEEVPLTRLGDLPQPSYNITTNDESVKDISSSQSKYNSVRKKYYGTSEWLKAPNGKNTKLTEEQWIQVRTPNFIKWFGDWINDPDNASKVVDENGEPLAVYHTPEF